MKCLNRYYTFGVRKEWVKDYINFKDEFWEDSCQLSGKIKEALMNFLKDSNLVYEDKLEKKDKFKKWKFSSTAQVVSKLGIENNVSWAILLTNLSYTPQFSWYIEHITRGRIYGIERLKMLLNYDTENDKKGLKKRSFIEAFKFMLIKTPIGKELGLGYCDFNVKIDKRGRENIWLISITRGSWTNPDPTVILYGLYKFAEACGDYHQFSLTRLLNYNIDSDGVSPSLIFGLDRENMEGILMGLSMKYPEFINASFTHDLDNITLRAEKTSTDVLNLFYREG